MSDFIENLVDLLPEHNSMKKPDNQLRQVLDYTVGEWFDNRFDITSFRNNLFLQTATGKWLDLFGLDYSIPRKNDEADEDYRQRIIYEKLDNLTSDTLINEYGLELYCYVSKFNAKNNSLTSDNLYLSSMYMASASDELQSILENKFILDEGIFWLEDYASNYILNNNDEDILLECISIYNLSNLNRYFFNKGKDIKEVFLRLPSARDCINVFYGCSNLKKVDLNLPNAVDCTHLFNLINFDEIKLDLPSAIYCNVMFGDCTIPYLNLDLPHAKYCVKMFMNTSIDTFLKLNLPVLEEYEDMFEDCQHLEELDVIIPNNIVTGFKNYVLGLNINGLTSFKINGVEYL